MGYISIYIYLYMRYIPISSSNPHSFLSQKNIGHRQSNSTKVKAWHVNMWKNIYLKFIPTRNSHPWSGVPLVLERKNGLWWMFFCFFSQEIRWKHMLVSCGCGCGCVCGCCCCCCCCRRKFQLLYQMFWWRGCRLESRLGWRWIWQQSTCITFTLNS